jgi:hypothetical protein
MRNIAAKRPRAQIEWEISVTRSQLANRRKSIEMISSCLQRDEKRLKDLMNCVSSSPR